MDELRNLDYWRICPRQLLFARHAKDKGRKMAGKPIVVVENIQSRILNIRGQKVMLDAAPWKDK